MHRTFFIKQTLPLLGAAGLLMLGSCSSGHEKKDKPQTENAITVVLSAPVANNAQGLNISGQVEASQTANISTRVMGYITMLKVKVGDRVSKGQLLATISNQDLLAKRGQTEAMIAEAEANVKSAKKDFDRFTVLYNQQSATAKEVDNVTLQYSAAKARLDGARQMRNEINAQLGYTSLTAPFSGIVTQKLADAGSIANPGMPILTIEQSGSYQVSASVPENMISTLKTGAAASITIAAINKTIQGTVSQINESSQFTGGQYIIKISIADKDKPGLYAGMYANVSIPLTAEAEVKPADNAMVMVPQQSIERREQLTGIYTISSNKTALLRWVRLGKTYGSQVEVLSGLDKNEQFIVSAEGKLYNGAPVKTR